MSQGTNHGSLHGPLGEHEEAVVTELADFIDPTAATPDVPFDHYATTQKDSTTRFPAIVPTSNGEHYGPNS